MYVHEMNYSRIQTPSKDKEMVIIAEEEIARLRRQLRIMEDDRSAFFEETGAKLDKQKKIITILVDEKNKIAEENSTATCKTQTKRDQKLQNIIIKLMHELEEYNTRARNEKFQLKELEYQIKKMNDNIDNIGARAIVPDQDYENHLKIGYKSIHVLNGRLDIATKRFSFILSDNKELREDINHLLNDRKNFNAMWEKLLKVARIDKKIMTEWIERATLAFDQREEWCSKLVALRKRAQNDFLSHSETEASEMHVPAAQKNIMNTKMRDIQRKLDDYSTLKKFLSTKGQIRILKDLEERELKRKMNQVENLKNKLLIHEQAMKEIQHFCVEEDTYHIASRFLKQEEENFALFNYVNEINHEIEQLGYGSMEMEKKIDDPMAIRRIREE